jgi:plasmid stabilization system protein ParE
MTAKFRIRYTSQAQTDIRALHHYITFELMSSETADNYIDGLLSKIYSLTSIADMIAVNYRESLQKHYGTNVRTVIFKNMTIIYNIIGDVVLVRRVIASSMVL